MKNRNERGLTKFWNYLFFMMIGTFIGSLFCLLFSSFFEVMKINITLMLGYSVGYYVLWLDREDEV